jgi:hypothetical protein
VLRIKNCRSAARDGSQPIPAFCDRPNRSPEDHSRSIVGVNGNDPAGPAAVVVTE